jgi:hypothetical protein
MMPTCGGAAARVDMIFADKWLLPGLMTRQHCNAQLSLNLMLYLRYKIRVKSLIFLTLL